LSFSSSSFEIIFFNTNFPHDLILFCFHSGSWALAGGGAARCVSADGSFAVTLRCVPLQAHLARTIDEAHPNVVMAAVGAAASAAAAVAAVATNSVPSVDTAAAIAAAEDPISSNSSGNNRQHSLATLLRAGARDAVTSSASINNSSNSSAKLVGVGPRGIGPNMLVLRGPQEQEQAEGEDTGKNSGDETEASSLAVVRVHPSSAALCRFAACDPRARRSVLATPLKAIAKAQISTASAAASGAASAASSGSSSSLAASHAIDEEWALGYSSSNNNNDEDGEGSASEAFSKSNAAYSASAPPCTFATLSPKAASAVWRRISQHVASGFQVYGWFAFLDDPRNTHAYFVVTVCIPVLHCSNPPCLLFLHLTVGHSQRPIS